MAWDGFGGRLGGWAFVFCILAASSVYLRARREQAESLLGLLQRLINKLPRVEWEKVKDLTLLLRFSCCYIAVQHLGDLFGNFFI